MDSYAHVWQIALDRYLERTGVDLRIDNPQGKPCPSGSRCMDLEGTPGSPRYLQTVCAVCSGLGFVPDEGNAASGSALASMKKPFTDAEYDLLLADGDAERVWEARREAAISLLKKGTDESWSKIRARIFERDGGICEVCGYHMNNDEGFKFFELGHKVDRVAGGSDTDGNLCVQCSACNRFKPVHDTIEEYEAWQKSGGLFGGKGSPA